MILRVASEHRLAVVDLRLVCTDPDDRGNRIEPSGRGGREIAIARAVGAPLASASPSRVFAL